MIQAYKGSARAEQEARAKDFGENLEQIPQIKDSDVNSEKSLKLNEQYVSQIQGLQGLEYESAEPDDLRDHFRLIDQIQQRSNRINH